MSDSIIVRVTLDSYDVVHPAEKQTQVYVQIPEVARASWLLDASFYAVLKSEPWPHVVDSAHEEYERRGVVSDSASAAARKAIVDWLLLSEGEVHDARYDAVQAAWEADQARQHPVARKLLKENERLRARVAELEAERHTTNESLDEVVRELRTSYAERARRETHPGRRQAWRMLAQVEESERVAEALLTPEAERSADKLTQLMAPAQALRGVPDGEHYRYVHHGYGKGRDLPETGGAR